MELTPEERALLSSIGRKGGQAKSEKKTEANRIKAIKRWESYRDKNNKI